MDESSAGVDAFEIDPRFEVSLLLVKRVSRHCLPHTNAMGFTRQNVGQLFNDLSPCISRPVANDKIVILEDVDKDGKADKCSVWAEGLNVPLSFEFGNGGVYVSEEPHMTFLKDTDGDGKADLKRFHLPDLDAKILTTPFMISRGLLMVT